MQQENVNSSSEPRDENFGKFLTLYHQHEQKLLRYAQSLACPPITADDIFQESALKAMKKFPALRDETKFFSWFKTIIFRTFLRMLENADAEKRKAKTYTEMHLRRQSDSEAEILEEMYSRIDKPALGITAGPHMRNTTSQKIPQQHLSPADEIHREISREGLKSFSEIQNETDFHPWIEEKSKNARKEMYKKQQNPQKRTTENENDGRE